MRDFISLVCMTVAPFDDASPFAGSAYKPRTSNKATPVDCLQAVSAFRSNGLSILSTSEAITNADMMPLQVQGERDLLWNRFCSHI